jgi:hypothetical protein
MSPLYGSNRDPHDSRNVLAMVRDLYSKHPEARYREPYELQSLLFSLGYTDELLDEGEIAAAIEVARGNHDPDQGAA